MPTKKTPATPSATTASSPATAPRKRPGPLKAAPRKAAPRKAAPRKAAPRKVAARKTAKADPAEDRTAALKTVVLNALADMKALEIKILDVRGLTDVADTMVIASGTSDRHVRSVAQRLVEKTKAAGFRPHGVEGQQDSDWVLIDLQ